MERSWNNPTAQPLSIGDILWEMNNGYSTLPEGALRQICEALYEEHRRYLYATEIAYQGESKTIYTVADDYEEAGQKFHRYLVCQWVGYPFDGPETLMAGVFDKIEDGSIIS